MHLTTPIPISPKFTCRPKYWCQRFNIFCRHKFAGTNKLCVALRLLLECGIVTPAISLHLSLSRPNLAAPLNIGVNDFALFVGTRVEDEANQVCICINVVVWNGNI